MRCDLHVHTIHSGMCTVPIAREFCRESYTSAEAVYDRLKTLGMDLVTVTDHDSIEAAETLRGRPGFFLSEEVTCRLPGGSEAHVGVYGITERDHVHLQRHRNDPESFAAFIRERRLLASINHIFSGLTGRREISDFDWFRTALPAMETRNGAMLPVANENAEILCRWLRKAPVGGSDAHTLENAGTVWTRVHGARDVSEYLDGLRQRRGVVYGRSGGYRALSRTVLRIACELMKEKPWTRAFAPLLLGLPGVMLLNYVQEACFARYWSRKLQAAWQVPTPRSVLHEFLRRAPGEGPA